MLEVDLEAERRARRARRGRREQLLHPPVADVVEQPRDHAAHRCASARLSSQAVAGARAIGHERAVDRLEHAVEEHRLDAHVVVEVLEVAQPVDAAERMS